VVLPKRDDGSGVFTHDSGGASYVVCDLNDNLLRTEGDDDYIRGGDGDDELSLDADDISAITDESKTFEWIDGGDGYDQARTDDSGGSESVSLEGGGGNDELIGSPDDDAINGGPDTDRCRNAGSGSYTDCEIEDGMTV
jgi:Ca2+-binding RTX toxin-like protein